MSGLDEERDELLRAAALGKLDRGDPRVVRRLQTDPELARAVHELDRTRTTTERVLREGARLTEEAAREATPDDRAAVLATIERLSRDDDAGRRRGRLFLVVGLLAAASLAYVLVRPDAPPPPAAEVWMGERGKLHHEEEATGPGRLEWKVELLPGDELWLSFFALRDGGRAELLLGPLDVSGSTEWQAKDTDERAKLSGDWQAELERRSAGEVELLGMVRAPSSH